MTRREFAPSKHSLGQLGRQIPVRTDFTRFKHWFQFDDDTVRNDSAVVIAMFRDPYDWVEAMHERPHHAHAHIGLDWEEFVTKPWTGPRGPADRAKVEMARAEGIHLEGRDVWRDTNSTRSFPAVRRTR